MIVWLIGHEVESRDESPGIGNPLYLKAMPAGGANLFNEPGKFFRHPFPFFRFPVTHGVANELGEASQTFSNICPSHVSRATLSPKLGHQFFGCAQRQLGMHNALLNQLLQRPSIQASQAIKDVPTLWQ